MGSPSSGVHLEIALRPWQKRLFKNPARFLVVVVHRRAGKTYFGIQKLITAALQTPNCNLAFIAPQRDQAKRNVWDGPKISLIKAAKATQFVKSVNLTELSIEFQNGSKISVFGSDNPDALRGQGFDGVVMDEVADMPSDTWGKVVRPALADNRGWALFIGTPKGRNMFFDLYNRAERDRDALRSTGWDSVLLTVDDTHALAPEEVQAMRDDLTDDEVQQELYCSFEAAIQGAYFGKQIEAARIENRITRVPYNPAYPVHTAWDLGVKDATAIWFFQLIAMEIRLLNYKEFYGAGLIDTIRDLEHVTDADGKACNYQYGYHIAPWDIAVRDFGTGKSRIETAEEHGIYFEIASKLPPKDGINAVRKIFPRCVFDSNNTQQGVDRLSQYRERIDPRTGTRTGRPEHGEESHAADSFRYLATHVDELPRHGEGLSMPASISSDTFVTEWDEMGI